jgi:hypothetical protein
MLVATPTMLVANEPPRGARCNLDLHDPHVVLVDATVVAIQQSTYHCEAGVTPHGFTIDDAMRTMDAVEGSPAKPAATTGCVFVIDSPVCGLGSKIEMTGGSGRVVDDDVAPIEIQIDGAKQRATYVTGNWRACGLAPGAHMLTMCSALGPVACSANVTAATTTPVNIATVAPSAQLRVERAYHGPVSPGATVTVEIAASADGARLELPARATFAWRSDDPRRQARLCDASAESPPPVQGCARCDARGSGSVGWLLVGIAIAFLITRRRR